MTFTLPLTCGIATAFWTSPAWPPSRNQGTLYTAHCPCRRRWSLCPPPGPGRPRGTFPSALRVIVLPAFWFTYLLAKTQLTGRCSRCADRARCNRLLAASAGLPSDGALYLDNVSISRPAHACVHARRRGRCDHYSVFAQDMQGVSANG